VHCTPRRRAPSADGIAGARRLEPPLKRAAALAATLVPVLAAAVFVFVTSRALPIEVASHFGPGGIPDGFMSHRAYVRFMLAFVVLLPLLLGLGASAVARLPVKLVNIPNREYWLAPERRAQAVAMLQRLMRSFAIMLVVFLCYVHWLVVRANASMPPLLDGSAFAAGLGAFMVALVAWIVMLRRRFRAPGS
jgi:hypothetical protein